MLKTALCGCGSGLRETRCCDSNAAAWPETGSAEILDPMAAEASKLFSEQKTREAETLLLKLLDLAPNHRLALRLLLELRKAANINPATEVLGRRLAALPGTAVQATAANLALAQWLIGQNRHAEAEPAAREALKNSPRDPTAHHVMGAVFSEAGQLRQGEHHYRRALALQAREDGTLLGNLAWNLKLQGKLEESAANYQRALAIRPDNRRAIGGFAQLEAARGNYDHAGKLLDAALEETPADRSLRLLRVLLDLILKRPEAVLERLDDTVELLPPELIARGQACLALDRTADAIAAFAMAKQLQRERFGRQYAPNTFIARAAQYRAFFTANRLAALPKLPAMEPPQPVFLLGFPGCGTSLLEQLMAKIPGFIAGDELMPIAELLSLPAFENYPDCLLDFLIGDGLDRLAALRTQVLETLGTACDASKEHQFITLRAAGDVWHLGLIKMLFPEAPIIHLLRHPLDVAVTNFSREKQLEADCAVSLKALAQHFDLTMSMIRHYRGQLTLRYLPIRYEALVEDPAAALREILEFIGFDAAIPAATELRANGAAAAGRVPNHAVVQQPIHDRGIGRFRIFEAAAPNLFSEIRPILAPWIEALGYAS